MADGGGYVYALRSPGHAPDLYKIGGTEHGADVRARALSRDTGVPSPFEVVLTRPVPDWRRAENLLKGRLRSTRWSGFREFYKVGLDRLEAEMDTVVKTMSGHPKAAREDLAPGASEELAAVMHARPRSPSEELYLRYWSAFQDLLTERPIGLLPPRPPTTNFMNFYGQLPRTELTLGVQTSTQKRLMKVFLMMKPDHGKELLNAFRGHIQEIQKSLPEALQSENQSDRKEQRSFLWVESTANSADSEGWENEHEWLLDRLDRLHRAVRPIADTIS